MTVLQIGDININIKKKDIKNLHLKVLPPHGKVEISAPHKMDIAIIRVFVISKLHWIKQKQGKFINQEREPKREYIDLESHYFFGRRYLLKVHETNSAPKVTVDYKYINLYVRPNTSSEKRAKVIDEWHRAELKKVIPDLISKWEDIIGVQVNEFGVKKMRTKWGTCNITAKRIWLNLELAKKPLDSLEYVIVHEMVHLLERSHNKRFVAFMDTFMPKWRFHQEELNRLPYGYVNWSL